MKYIKEINMFDFLEPNTFISMTLKVGALISFYRFIKGLIKDLKFRTWLKNASQEDLDAYHKYLNKKMEPTEFKILSNKIDQFFKSGKKMKITEDFGYLTLQLDDLTIKISKLRNTITWNHIKSLTLKVEKEFIDPIKITEKEINELKNALEDDKLNDYQDVSNFVNSKY